MLRFLFVFLLLFAFPSVVHAYNYPYYAQHEGARKGSEIERFSAAARFVHERLYPARKDTAEYLCSISKLLPQNLGVSFLQSAAQKVSKISNLPEQYILIALTSDPCRKNVSLSRNPPAKPKLLELDQKGSVVSSNPVWNACIRNTPMTGVFVRSNTDTFIHRQRSIIVKIPLSCRDYHRGQLKVWTYPDDPSVHLVLDSRGRLLGDAPIGYVLSEK